MTFDGGAGLDTLTIVSTDEAVNIDVSDINFENVSTWSGNDTLDGSSVLNFAVNFNTRDGDDVLIGTQFNDTLSAGDGDDTITGGDGSDTITGGLGSDSISAGAGNDLILQYDHTDSFLDGGSGNDRLRIDPRSSGVNIDLTAQGIESIEISRGNGIANYEARGDDVFNATNKIDLSLIHISEPTRPY